MEFCKEILEKYENGTLEEFLKSKGFADVKVNVSKIPYRG